MMQRLVKIVAGLLEWLIILTPFWLIAMGAMVVMRTQREFAYNNEQKANLKRLVEACRLMESHFGTLPPAWGEYRWAVTNNATRTGNPFVHMLPTLDQLDRFEAGNFDAQRIPLFLPEADSSIPRTPAGHSSVVANLRVFSRYGAKTKWNEPIDDLEKCRGGEFTIDKIDDGGGNTVLFTTKYAVCNGIHNRFHLPPWDPSGGGPYFGAGSHADGPSATEHIPTGQITKLPAYQIKPSFRATGQNVCNNDRGLFGHSFGGAGLAVAMGDTSVRNLSFAVTGDTFAKAICPNDGLALGNDW